MTTQDTAHEGTADAARDDRTIRQAVVDRYGARARRTLESAGAKPADDSCCGPVEGAATSTVQLLDEVPAGAVPPADTSSESGSGAYGTSNYAVEVLDELPATVSGASAGCGNPVAIAELSEGEAVLDLGSGGGIDCFLSAQQVGESGEVWGLDMTPDMVQLARHNAEQVGVANVRFRLGEIEDIPFEDGHFDAIISNCVINLSTDKPQVFREAFRVLKPGGRLRVSDMVWTREMPEATREDIDEWAACVAGALPLEGYLAAIRGAGFVDVSATYEDSERGLVSAAVSATRPV
jgi:arsenite methyltransferase